MKKVNVLGTEYSIIYKDEDDQKFLDRGCDGLCDTSVKEIYIAEFKDDPKNKKDLKSYQNQVLRHEIIHAFLFESGLDTCSSGEWAKNEETVDWIAIQFNKLKEAFHSVECD